MYAPAASTVRSGHKRPADLLGTLTPTEQPAAVLVGTEVLARRAVSRIVTVSASGCCSIVTCAVAGPACLMTLFKASWTIR